jgi:hypothetical protein
MYVYIHIYIYTFINIYLCICIEREDATLDPAWAAASQAAASWTHSLFRGGLVFKANRLFLPLKSRLESNREAGKVAVELNPLAVSRVRFSSGQ